MEGELEVSSLFGEGVSFTSSI